ncbi:MAG TPA: hypothetical protein VL993_02080, partial [Stellaceae bacterium]|nr:hypothetical protein [Stellaceae bacterium]
AGTAAIAQEHWHDRGPHFGGGDIHHFADRDFGLWRGGHWFHGPYGGRVGWWWIVGDSWYFYPAPVYPYPDPYVPPVVTAAPVAPAGSSYWYYCSNPSGYYPYVPECGAPWQPVAAGAQAPVAAPPIVPPPATR